MKLSRDPADLDDKAYFAYEYLRANHPECFITETGRTLEQQKINIKNGVSWTLNSYHLMMPKARAFDIAFYGDELYPMDFKRWEPVIKSMELCGMDCGYYLWGKDWMHFQDNNKPFKEDYMIENNKYVNFKEAPGLLTELTGENALQEKDIKALINIAINRLKEELNK
jgi:hypothetical protein